MRKFLIGVGIGFAIEVLITIIIILSGVFPWLKWISAGAGNFLIGSIFVPIPAAFIFLQWCLFAKKPYDKANGIFWGTIVFFLVIYILLQVAYLSGAQMDF